MAGTDEEPGERPCEGALEVARIRLCLTTGTEVVAMNERETAFPEDPMLPPPEKPTRDCALLRPLPSPLPLVSSETPTISSIGPFFKVFIEVVDIRLDRLRSKVTSRSSDRLPRGVN